MEWVYLLIVALASVGTCWGLLVTTRNPVLAAAGGLLFWPTIYVIAIRCVPSL